MILSELRDYIKTHRRAALVDISQHFDVEPEAVRGMVDLWIRKGKVRKLPGGMTCDGCCECGPALVEIYEWTG